MGFAIHKNYQGGSNGQSKYTAHKVELHIPHSIHTKIPTQIMFGTNKKDLAEIIKKLCEMKEVTLIEGKVCVDHIHMYVAIPPIISVSDFMSYLKEKS